MVDGSRDTAPSFPRQQATTAKFTNGAPRGFTVANDGSRVAFVRSPAGDDPTTSLWVLDVDAGTERLVAEPGAILAGAEEQLTAAERARRERTREVGRGIVGYSADPGLRRAAFALGGRLFLADLLAGGATELSARSPVMVPELDPTGAAVAYVSDGDLRVSTVGGDDRPLAGDEDPDVAWGVAEFAAAEEMDRYRGMWWAPDGSALLAARVDNRPIGVWHIANPADPAGEPQAVRYPAAGTDNAIVTLHVLPLDGDPVEVSWDRERFPYVVRARWDAHGPLLAVMSRDQRHAQVLSADPGSGTTATLAEHADDVWVELPPGIPARTEDGRLVTTVPRDGMLRLAVDGDVVTPASMHVLDVVDVGDDLLLAATDEPTERQLWRVSPAATSSARRTVPACTWGRAAVARPSWCPRRWTGSARPPPSCGTALPRRRSCRTPPRRSSSRAWSSFGPAPGRSGRPSCVRPTTVAAGPFRCCSTPTAGRTTRASSPRGTRSWSRSGGPTRGSPW
jgi:dipeptidyl-peptidase 4